jgi:hypothetical protein
MWVQFLPGVLFIGSQLDVSSATVLTNVEVAGETPVEPTILIAPWRNTSAVGFDPTGPRGIRPCSPTQRQPSQKRFSADASPAMGTFPGRLTGQALPGLFAKEIVPQCVVWGASPQPSTIFSSPA